MLIICSGPDGFRAKQKIRGFVGSFKDKYDKTGNSVETLSSQEPYAEIVSRLSAPSLFHSKTMVVCHGLMDGLKVGQIKTLAKSLLVDADQTVILDHEDKKPTQKTADYFTDKSLLVYAHDELEGSALRKEVAAMCAKYGVDAKQADRLIAGYANDLWAIDAALQILSAGTDGLEIANKEENSVFQITEAIMKGDADWLKQAWNMDKDDVLNVLISQYRSWHMVQAGVADGVHPYVQKKMSMLKIKQPLEKSIAAYRSLYASRNSIAFEQDADTLIF